MIGAQLDLSRSDILNSILDGYYSREFTRWVKSKESASTDSIGVVLGGILGHTICALITVIGARAIVSHLS